MKVLLRTATFLVVVFAIIGIMKPLASNAQSRKMTVGQTGTNPGTSLSS
jgi:hypothetical protein